MKDVALLAGVGIKTVSRVINNEPAVSEATIKRVRDAAARLNFRPDHGAGSLRRSDRKTASIGLIVSSVSNPFSAALHRTIEDVAIARNVAVFASSVDDDPARESGIVSTLLRRRVDGIIMTPAGRNQGYLAAEQAYGTPFVFIDREPSGIDADTVISDHAIGAEAATRHLLERGHRRIGYLGDRLEIQSARERHRGYLRAYGRAGVSIDGVPQIDDLHDELASYEAARALLESDDRPTALFTGQNLVTIGAVRALRELGLHRTVALVGFDDFPLADLLEPGVTVVAQDPQAIGELAAERVFARIDGDQGPPQALVVPTTLIPRGSGEIPPPASA
jgi:LacI family transcriptional regulator